jgi:dUTP pyrophosphatase
MKVKFKKLHEGAILPKKATEGSAAYDLYVPEDFIVEPGRTVIPLGFAMEMTPGYEALIDARSGFSCRGMEGYEVLTSFDHSMTSLLPYRDYLRACPEDNYEERGKDTYLSLNPMRFDCDVIEGKIDSDFRKGVGVIVHSRDKRTFLIKAGTRIAQMTFHKVEKVEWEETDELSQTDRDGGFGSTGTK